MSDKMSRQDEITKILIEHDCLTRLDGKKYKVISKEIEKLFEVEGEVEYVVQQKYKKQGNWASIFKPENKKDGIDYVQSLSKEDSLFSYKLIKRTTIDEIIEE